MARKYHVVIDCPFCVDEDLPVMPMFKATVTGGHYDSNPHECEMPEVLDLEREQGECVHFAWYYNPENLAHRRTVEEIDQACINSASDQARWDAEDHAVARRRYR